MSARRRTPLMAPTGTSTAALTHFRLDGHYKVRAAAEAQRPGTRGQAALKR